MTGLDDDDPFGDGGAAGDLDDLEDILPDANEVAGGGGGFEEEEAQGGPSARVLNQDEIDHLLGMDVAREEREHKTGIYAILDKALVNYERLPMLEVVFDRMVRMMSTSLRNFTSDNVEVSLDHISSVRFGDYLNSIPLPAMLSVFKAEEWDNYGLLTVDSQLIYSVVDVLLGGRQGAVAMRIEGRPYTTIERNLVQRMVHVVLGDLSAAFDPLSPVTFRFERLETNPRFATIARPGNAAILAKLRVDMEDRGGKMEMLVPYATLEPVRELLLQQFMGERFGRDSIWEGHLVSELWQTDVDIHAILDQVGSKLGTVLGWRPGSRLDLRVTSDSNVELYCGDVPLFHGKMGQKQGNVAVRIEGRAVREF